MAEDHEGSDGAGIDALVERATAAPGSLSGADLDRLGRAVGGDPERDVVGAIHAVAEADPERTERLARAVEPLLSADRSGVRERAIYAVARLTAVDPGRVAPIVPAVADRLEDDSLAVVNQALQVLSEGAAETPGAVADAVDVSALARFLGDDTLLFERATAELLARLARADPGAVEPVADDLAELVGDRRPGLDPERLGRSGADGRDGAPSAGGRGAGPEGGASPGAGPDSRVGPGAGTVDRAAESALRHDVARARAAAALAALADARPDALAGSVPALVEAFDAEAGDPMVRDELLGVLEGLAPGHAGAMAEAGLAAPLGAVLADADEGPAARAAWVLAFLAEHDGPAVADAVGGPPATDRLVDLLGADEARVRSAAVTLLAYVAPHRSAAVEPLTGALVEHLDDDHAPVRAGVAVVLGALGDGAGSGGGETLDRLRTLAAEDPDAEVRQAASDAVAAIESARDGGRRD